MSLLLDALRRAEEARRAKEADNNAALTVSPVAVGKPARPSQPSVPRTHDLSIEELPRTDPAVPPVIGTQELVPAKSPHGNLALEEISAPIVSPDSLSSPASGAARARNATVANAPSDVAQRDGARNVFAAKQSSVQFASDAGRRKWILPAVAALFVLVGAGGWYVWNEVNRVSPPFVARGPSPPVALPSAALNTGQIASSPVTTSEPSVARVEVPTMPPLLLPLPADALSSRLQAPASLVPERALTGREALAMRLREAPVPKEPPMGLRLAQSSAQPRVNPELTLAYQALANGDYATAQQRYAKVVLAEPSNVDAQLGLATAAARIGDTALANRHYRQVLALDPRNGLALVGLIALNDGVASPTLEIELKTLIGRNPDAAPLHFALGNIYAGEKRWTEAQQAYFDAFRIDPANPDYLFNLAVSLDQLRQTKLALDYYRRAEAIAQTRGGGQFDRNTIAKRIRELSGENGRTN